jgi:hypothetical protein
MTTSHKRSTLALALLAATMLTPPGPALAAPGDALGPEFRVNSFTMGRQDNPAVAMDADGDFIVVWTSDGQDGSDYGVFAQRFDAAGNPQGGEFQVNSFTTGVQNSPSVAMDADGDFVVAWESDGQDGSGRGILAQRFDAAGNPQGGEFQVNTFTAGGPIQPDIAMDADGDFVVAWTSWNPRSSSLGVFAQRFDAVGNAVGVEFQVNSFTTGAQMGPAVAMDADGDFVVAWQSDGQDGSGVGIFAQHYDAAGVAQGPEFQVNSETSSAQASPAVAMDADGDFVVAWMSDGQDGSGFGIFAQRYNAAGLAQGPEFQVNSVTLWGQSSPTAAMDFDGDFVVAWHSWKQDGSYDGVFAQRYDAAGAAQGPEFQVNTFTTGGQYIGSVAMDADGDFVVAWMSDGQDGSDFGVFGQRYQGEGPVAGDFTVDGRADILWRNTDTGAAILWQMDGFVKEATGSIGGAGTDWQIRALADFDADTKTDVLWRNTATGAAVIWLMDGFTKSATGGIGGAGPDWEIVGAGDFDGDDHADILWRNTATGANVVWKMDGLSKTDSGGIGTVPLVWEMAGLGTFNSDARSDILWRNTETGSTVIWKMNGIVKEDAGGIGAPSLTWRIESVGDGDGDRQSDIIWRNTGTGATLVWQMDGFVKDDMGGIGGVPLVWEVQ